MELRQLTTFRAVANTLSFSKAATSLNYAQSTVSAQIQALEVELNTTLFERLGKRVVITHAGHQLLHYAEQMLMLAGEARTAVSTTSIPQGLLTISAPETLCIYRLPPVLRTFRELYPQVQLTFCATPYQGMPRALREGAMDVAFVLDTPIEHAYLEVVQLISEPLIVVAHPMHPLVGETAVPLTALAAQPMLLTETTCTYRLIFEQALHQERVQLAAPVEFHSVEAIKQCAIAGMGLAFLPKIAITNELAAGQLIDIPFADQSFEIATQIAWHKDKWLSPTLSAFIDVVKATYQPISVAN
jgi:DNA-binding transcriptional LysR family regulator